MNSKLIKLLLSKIFVLYTKKVFSKEETESSWEEFYNFSKDFSFYELAHFKDFSKKIAIKSF